MAATGTIDIPSVNPTAAGIGSELVTEARKFLGDEYVYGATGPNTFDCSGLTQYVYKQLGITIPRTSEEQFSSGTPVTADEAQPGDLVFFGGSGPGYDYDGTPSSPGHVGIYIGGGQMINAPTQGEPVDVKSTVGNVGFRRYDNAAVSGGNSDLSSIGGEIAGAAGSLFSIPSQITGAFETVDTAVGAAYDSAKLFFQPSTYVRIGSGVIGFVFVFTALLLLMKEAKS